MATLINGLTMLLAFIVLLGVIVFIHELGHFLMAKAFNIKVTQFSLGFPPKMVGITFGETEYCLSWIPLGGYCAMVGEGDGEVAPEDLPRSFNAQAPWKRALVLAAGPCSNLILPIILYFFVFAGSHEVGAPTIGYVKAASPAAVAGILPGDTITAINGQEVKAFSDIGEILDGTSGSVAVSIKRGTENLVLDITPNVTENKDIFGDVTQKRMLGISLAKQKAMVAITDQAAPAALAGVKTGDIIKAVNGVEISTWYELRSFLQKEQGTHFELAISRETAEGDGSSDFLIALDAASELPAGYPAAYYSSAEPARGYLGLGLANVTISRVDEGENPAHAMGLLAGDRLLKFDDQEIGFWEIDLPSVDVTTERLLHITVLRGQEVKVLEYNLKRIEPDYLANPQKQQEQNQFGAYNYTVLLDSDMVTINYGFFKSINLALQKVWSDIALTAKALSHLFTGRLPLDTMGGPIMLFYIAGEAAEHGLAYFVSIMAYISINIGLLNLLPVPPLDGGHLAGVIVESVIRRPIPPKVKHYIQLVGLLLLMLLMFVAFKNDVIRYFIR